MSSSHSPGDLDVFLSLIESRLRADFTSPDLSRAIIAAGSTSGGLSSALPGGESSPSKFLSLLAQVLHKPAKPIKLRALMSVLGLDSDEVIERSASASSGGLSFGSAAGARQPDDNDEIESRKTDAIVWQLLQDAEKDGEMWVRVVAGIIKGIMFTTNRRDVDRHCDPACRGETAKQELDKITTEVLEKVVESSSMASSKLLKLEQKLQPSLDDDDEDDDFDNDDGGVNEDGDERSKSRRKCYPVVGSPVHRYLDGIHTRVQRHLNRGSNSELQGHHNSINISDTFWIAPKGNPVGDSFGTTAKPDSFYTARVFVFLWDPMLQFPNHVPSKVTCPKCGSTNTKCDGGWNFRPFHWFDRIIYIYHRFVACNGCGARCPTVRADFISKLPTLVAEQFPFTLPSERGPGLYDPMISMMKLFFTEGIMWGKFAKVINSLQSSNFARNHVSYLDSLDHWLTVQPSLFVESRVPLPFSPQTSQEGYCGIKLRPSLGIHSCHSSWGKEGTALHLYIHSNKFSWQGLLQQIHAEQSY
mmetsp:Transcript_2564/g.5670  ORF Transcript_2564/g.5670 Transcript_2564/m.5670 type:complete len:529 (+) Transcript_2564:131-1717(+)